MAYTAHNKAAARAAYIHDNLPLEQISAKLGISAPTLTRWKRDAKKQGDCWDKLRAANLMAGEGIESVQRQMLAEYVNQHKTLLESVLVQSDIATADKVRAISSLADSFTKMIAASRKILPETNELAIALDTLSLLGDYIRREFPHYGAAFVEVLEPFGEEITKKYG